MNRIIFDLDGTLLNTFRRHELVLQDCMLHFCYSDIPKDYLLFKRSGYSTRTYLEKVFGLKEEISRKISDLWVKHIEDIAYLEADMLYSDAKECLERCRKLNYQAFLVSARSNMSNFYNQIEILKLEEFFTDVVCVSPYNSTSDKKEQIFRIGADLIVGDTEVEWKAAAEAGIASCILNRGFRSRTFWEANHMYESQDSLQHLFEIR